MNLLSYGGYHMYWPSANGLLLLSTNNIINECTNMGLRFQRIVMIACKSTVKMVTLFGRMPLPTDGEGSDCIPNSQ
jgi:hypothetical protein